MARDEHRRFAITKRPLTVCYNCDDSKGYQHKCVSHTFDKIKEWSLQPFIPGTDPRTKGFARLEQNGYRASTLYTLPTEEVIEKEQWNPDINRSSWVEWRADQMDPPQSHYRSGSFKLVPIRKQYNWK